MARLASILASVTGSPFRTTESSDASSTSVMEASVSRVMDRDGLAEVAACCQRNGIRLISDEIYHGITYGRRAETILSFTSDAILVNSFSKYFSMTGWRLGWMVVPEDLLRSIECLAQNLFISPPTLSQIGGLAAFGCREELDRNVARYAANREILLEKLPEAGFGRLAPVDGAFYAYADVSARPPSGETANIAPSVSASCTALPAVSLLK